METIYLIALILTTSGVSLLLYKYIISKQRLQYDNKINSELIISGFAYNLILTIAFLLLKRFAQPIADAIYSIVFCVGAYVIMYRKIVKPAHYINKYDIVIYSLCLGIGITISNILFVALIPDGFNSALTGISAILVPIAYMMIFSFFLIKFLDGNKKALFISLVLPVIVVFIDAVLYKGDSWLVITLHIVYYFILYGIFIILFFKTIRKNVRFEGIDSEEKMMHFENNDTFKEKLTYRFDSFMSHGKLALGALLLVIGLIVVLIVTAIILTETPEITNGEISTTLWLSFMRVLDPGNVSGDPEFNNPKFVLITTIATFIGLALVATYIGIISGDFSSRMERLREGNSKILEKNHILFIGFSEDTLSIVDNLMKFHKGRDSLNIVILSSESRKEMEEQIHEYNLLEKHHRIICRSGDTESRTSLMNMAITTASTVVITGDQSDDNIRIAMMVNDILRAEHFNDIDILLQVERSEDLIIARNTFGKRMKIFSSRDFDFDPIFRGFMLKEYLNLYGNLIGVDGDLVVSLIEEKNCIGKTFGEIINGFIYSDVIGLVTEEQIILNPDKQTLIRDTHKLILLAPVDTDPHYIEPPKSYVPQIVKSSQNLNFIRETVETVLLIGNDSENLLTERIESQYPEIKLLNVKTISPIKTLIKEIDGIMTSQSPDIVVFMDSETEDYDRSDDLFLKLSAYMDSKYNRKENNYVIATYMHSSQNTKFVYELDYIDMVFNNDNNRRMALRIVDRTNRIQRVEQKLLEAGDRIGAVLAADITGTDEKQLADVYRDCVEHDLILVGYIIREGGFINVKLNPGKNDRIRFDNDDLLLVLK